MTVRSRIPNNAAARLATLGSNTLSLSDTITRCTAKNWSVQQADLYIDELSHIFETLVAVPTLGGEWTEFTPPVRIHVHKNHLIVYVVRDDAVAIIRILGGRQNWQAILPASGAV
jgi:toxin ParE1/3/4